MKCLILFLAIIGCSTRPADIVNNTYTTVISQSDSTVYLSPLDWRFIYQIPHLLIPDTVWDSARFEPIGVVSFTTTSGMTQQITYDGYKFMSYMMPSTFYHAFYFDTTLTNTTGCTIPLRRR